MSYAEKVRQSVMKIAGRYESLMQEYGELLAENRELKAKLVQQEQAGWQPMTTAPKDGSEILVLCDGEMLLVSWRESQGRLYGEWYTGFSCADDGRYSVTDPVLWARPPLQPKEISHDSPRST